MQKNLELISATGTQVVGVSYDSVKVLSKFSKSSKLTYPLLADPGSKTIRAFGIHYKKGLPQPCTYIIGKDRKVLASIFLDGYRKRHTPAYLVETIQGLDK